MSRASRLTRAAGKIPRPPRPYYVRSDYDPRDGAGAQLYWPVSSHLSDRTAETGRTREAIERAHPGAELVSIVWDNAGEETDLRPGDRVIRLTWRDDPAPDPVR